MQLPTPTCYKRLKLVVGLVHVLFGSAMQRLLEKLNTGHALVGISSIYDRIGHPLRIKRPLFLACPYLSILRSTLHDLKSALTVLYSLFISRSLALTIIGRYSTKIHLRIHRQKGRKGERDRQDLCARRWMSSAMAPPSTVSYSPASVAARDDVPATYKEPLVGMIISVILAMGSIGALSNLISTSNLAMHCTLEVYSCLPTEQLNSKKIPDDQVMDQVAIRPVARLLYLCRLVPLRLCHRHPAVRPRCQLFAASL